MAKRIIKTIKSKKGMTLVELIVAMLVMSVITLAVSAIMLPMYRTYDLAVNLAEVNTILDNVGALVMDDIAKAEDVTFNAGVLVISVRDNGNDITYRNDGTPGTNNVFVRDDGISTYPVLPDSYTGRVRGFYRNFHISVAAPTGALNEDDKGLVTLTLSLGHRDGGTVERTYTARPIGMQQNG